MLISRRNFLQFTGAALAFPNILEAQADTRSISKKLINRKQEFNMDITKVGSQPSGKGPEDWFTGVVRIDPLFQAPTPARVAGASVTFEPSARNAWHIHPLGQTLVIASGCGWAQSEGSPRQELHPGDVVWFSPNEKHWHGATATTAMTHIAIQEQLDGKAVEWLEKVADEDYQSTEREVEQG